MLQTLGDKLKEISSEAFGDLSFYEYSLEILKNEEFALDQCYFLNSIKLDQCYFLNSIKLDKNRGAILFITPDMQIIGCLKLRLDSSKNMPIYLLDINAITKIIDIAGINSMKNKEKFMIEFTKIDDFHYSITEVEYE